VFSLFSVLAKTQSQVGVYSLANFMHIGHSERSSVLTVGHSNRFSLWPLMIGRLNRCDECDISSIDMRTVPQFYSILRMFSVVLNRSDMDNCGVFQEE